MIIMAVEVATFELHIVVNYSPTGSRISLQWEQLATLRDLKHLHHKNLHLKRQRLCSIRIKQTTYETRGPTELCKK